ncbi:TonB-dependent receptor [Novosphingobium sp. FSY-8]|uniref:TonB-dependent receptor n=1 Tax=Novosphingobium ovatum TaxID=1908523 RepID=A0ABW9XDC0_9SPHN|nr:TonB-dependent receptor [Novosphingobium ovatum]NBC36495.1 TonB-dependent receptor [Novosphingobium ovatum]
MRNFSSSAFAASTLAIAVAAVATPAFAQSTGSVDFENQVIVVTGQRAPAVVGVQLPDTPKSKQVLDNAFLSKSVPGQSVNDMIGMIPGVASFNADPFGSSGGRMMIRGFDASRISETFDGLPLNDTGNYALYSNQQLDPELIEEVNVNLGTTDVDSPTASASGSTVNYRSRNPSDTFGGQFVASMGEFNFRRVFGMVNTGNLTSSGLRAWVAASSATNDMYSGGIGKVNKKQFNFKLYQPIGSGGDFIAISGHYNKNRNNMAPSVLLWNQNYGTRTVNSTSSNRYPTNMDEVFYTTASCTITAGVNGTADAAQSCGSAWEFRYNPSNTGNIRINSKFSLTDQLTLTIDPSFQYVKANGGGTITAREGSCSSCGGSSYGFMSGTYYFGRDLNGDGDSLDTVRLLAPSQTETHRLGLITSLRYKLNPNNTFRVSYSWDSGRHHQTGEVGYLNSNGFGADPFPVDAPITDASGNLVEKRNRVSYAILHQVAGEYSGRFFDNKLTVNVGLRAPFFKRNLTNYCFTTSSTGNYDCVPESSIAAYAAGHTTYAAPQNRVFNYSKVLPNAGFTYRLADKVTLAFNYSKGLQVPGTDNLYNSFWYPVGTAQARPNPETTDNYELGLRLRSRKVIAQISGWYTLFNNRLASAYDQDLGVTVYRNLGTVEKYGIDASLAWKANDALSLYVFGSYLKSRITSDVQAGTCASQAAQAIAVGSVYCVGTQAFFATRGKRESGAPTYTLGARAEYTYDVFTLGLQAKQSGPRYVNDVNMPMYFGTTPTVAFGARTPIYTTVDASLRIGLEKLGAPKKSYVQFNVQNLFNEFYIGGFDGGTTPAFGSTSAPQSINAYLPMPRTIVGTLSLSF